MAILKKFYLWVIGLLLVSLFLNAGQSMVVFDKSGSMRGFLKTRVLEKIYKGVRLAMESSRLFSGVELYGFDTRGLIPYNNFNDIKASGDTLIDKAFNDALDKKPELVVIITDNIQDTGQESTDSDVTKFYQLLKRQVVDWVFIFPLKMDFDGWTYTHGHWTGQRAAIMYAVLLQKPDISAHEQEEREEEFLNVVNLIEASAQTNRIRCKPLEKGVRMNFKEHKYDKKKARRGKVNITTEEVKIKFREFNPNPVFSLKLVISSKYSNIAVSKAKIEGIKSTNLEKVGLFKELNHNALPPPVIYPAEIKDLRPSTSQEHYIMKVQLKNIKLDKSFGALLQMPFNRNGQISGEMKLKIRIPKQELQLQANILNKFGTNRRDEPEKIYGLNQLVPVLTEGDEVDITYRKKFTIIMPYPGWPVAVLVALVLLLALLGFLVFRLARSTRNLYMVKVNGEEQYQFRFMPFQWKTLYSSEFGTMCQAQKSGNVIKVKPYAGFKWHNIGEEGIRSFDVIDSVSFTVLKEDSLSILVDLVSMDTKKREYEEDTYEESNELFQD